MLKTKLNVTVIKIKRSLVTFIRMRETVTEMATGCLRMVKMDIFVLNNLRFTLSSNQKMELCLYFPISSRRSSRFRQVFEGVEGEEGSAEAREEC